MRIFFISRLVEINSHHIKMNNPDEVPLASFKLDLSTSSCGVPFCMPGTQVKIIFFMLFFKDVQFSLHFRS